LSAQEIVMVHSSRHAMFMGVRAPVIPNHAAVMSRKHDIEANRA
jgi:hypothetical protein